MRLRPIPLAVAVAAISTVAVPAAAQRGCAIPRGQVVVVIGSEPLEMVPGESKVLPIGTSEAPYVPLTPLPPGCRPRWSVSKVSRAAIDAAGRLQVSRYARIGDTIVVTADVAGQSVFQAVHVIDPRPNPIAGAWTQEGTAQCTGRAPTEPVRELMIRRDGRFSVTFTPFETYKDYWGTYTYDGAAGALAMRAVGGNRVPEGIDLAGTARVENGRLVLRGVWLGQPEPGAPRACTYTFHR
ncbi:MAG: hypothetical protein ACJ8GN_14910 [Longimicrobiaceae bacterium]